MNRRGFLGTLLAGLTLDPERALWIPGRKVISIPKHPSTFWVSLLAERMEPFADVFARYRAYTEARFAELNALNAFPHGEYSARIIS